MTERRRSEVRYRTLGFQPAEDEHETPDPNDGFVYERASGPITVALDDRRIGKAEDVEEAFRMLARAMKDGAYWPNVWHVNERGNTSLVSILDYDTGAYEFTEVGYV